MNVRAEEIEKLSGPASTLKDVENGIEPEQNPSRHVRYSILLRSVVWTVFTGWWIAGLVLHRNDKSWIIPFLVWLCASLWAMPLQHAIRYIKAKSTGIPKVIKLVHSIPRSVRIPAGALLTITVIVTTTFAADETASNTRADRAISLFGLVVFVTVLWATSHNRKRVNWQTVIVGLLVQFLVALFVLRTTAGYDIFHFISDRARDLLGFAGDGVVFLTSTATEQLGWFLVGVVPPVIFFVALVRLLHHYHFIQWLVGKFALFFWWTMDVSGAEAVAAAACPFIGQGENAILIQPFLPHLTKAEIHQVMCSGFGTIAGSVLGAYIGLGVNPEALVSSCVMSIPASLAFSHLRYPEENETLTTSGVTIPTNEEDKAVNALHAFAKGAWLGLKVAGMIVAVLLSIIAMLGLVNGLLTWWGDYLNLKGKTALTVELIVGYMCYPLAFLLGIPRNHELLLVGRLIGVKIVTNEFVAYTDLVTQPEYTAMSGRSKFIATYALCGFGNIAALGTQIGVLSQVAPSRAADVSKIAVSALLTGILSTLSSASVAGMLVRDYHIENSS